MKLPKQISMGPYTIQIEEDPAPIDADGNEVCGWADWDDTKILIGETLTNDKKLDTFIHECIEMANEMADLQLSHTQIQVLGLLLSQALQPLINPLVEDYSLPKS